MLKNMSDLVPYVAATIDFDERVIALLQRRNSKVHVTDAGMIEAEITRRENSSLCPMSASCSERRWRSRPMITWTCAS
jgi:hypothetical protein